MGSTTLRDYTANNTTGESLSFTFTAAQWWTGNILNATPLNLSGTYKFIVVKTNTPSNFATTIAGSPGSVGQVSLELTKASTPTRAPCGANLNIARIANAVHCSS